MKTTSRPVVRAAFALAAAVVLVALALHAVLWYRTGRIDLAILANMGGLLFLMIVGAVDRASPRTRLVCGIVALAVILPSAVVIWLR